MDTYNIHLGRLNGKLLGEEKELEVEQCHSPIKTSNRNLTVELTEKMKCCQLQVSKIDETSGLEC